MILYVLNKYPSWMFLLFIMGTLLVFSLISYTISRWLYPKVLTEELSPAFGVMGTTFGFLLGFTIAILWQNHTAATKTTAEEAANFSLIINDMQLLSNESQQKLLKGLIGYIDIVKNTEWDAMKWGESAPIAWRSIHDVYNIMKTIKPATHLEYLAYADIFKELGGIVRARSERIHAIDSILPLGVMILLILGALFIVFSVSVNDPKKKTNHLFTVVMVCFLLSFNLGLVFVLAFPFSGDNGIRGRDLIEVIPIRLKLLAKQLKEQEAAEKLKPKTDNQQKGTENNENKNENTFWNPMLREH